MSDRLKFEGKKGEDVRIVVDRVRENYLSARAAFDVIFEQGGELYKKYSQDEAQKHWDEEIVPQIQQAKKDIRAAGEALADALEAEYAEQEKENAEAGTYALEVSFENKDGEMKKSRGTIYLTGLDPKRNGAAELHAQARSEISMIGLHNFRIKGDAQKFANASYTLAHEKHPDKKITGRCLIETTTGHIVTRETFTLRDR